MLHSIPSNISKFVQNICFFSNNSLAYLSLIEKVVLGKRLTFYYLHFLIGMNTFANIFSPKSHACDCGNGCECNMQKFQGNVQCRCGWKTKIWLEGGHWLGNLSFIVNMSFLTFLPGKYFSNLVLLMRVRVDLGWVQPGSIHPALGWTWDLILFRVSCKFVLMM